MIRHGTLRGFQDFLNSDTKKARFQKRMEDCLTTFVIMKNSGANFENYRMVLRDFMTMLIFPALLKSAPEIQQMIDNLTFMGAQENGRSLLDDDRGEMVNLLERIKNAEKKVLNFQQLELFE
jgi:hypothetical protein